MIPANFMLKIEETGSLGQKIGGFKIFNSLHVQLFYRNLGPNRRLFMEKIIYADTFSIKSGPKKC